VRHVCIAGRRKPTAARVGGRKAAAIACAMQRPAKRMAPAVQTAERRLLSALRKRRAPHGIPAQGIALRQRMANRMAPPPCIARRLSQGNAWRQSVRHHAETYCTAVRPLDSRRPAEKMNAPPPSWMHHMAARTNVTVRLNADENITIKRNAAGQGVSVSEYLRRAALAAKPTASASASVDPAIAQRLADLLDRMEAAAETDSQGRADALALISKAGNGFHSLLARYQAAAPKA